MNLQTTFLLSFLSLILACGQENLGELKLSSGKVVIDSLEWYEMDNIARSHPVRELGTFVGKVVLPKGLTRANESRCTGFLISQNILMTNHHCIPTALDARGVSVLFTGLDGNQETIDCSTFVGNNQQLDFALLKCEGAPGEIYGVAKLATQIPKEGDKIFVIQQNCDFYLKGPCDPTQKISLGLVKKVEDEIFHDADTLGGSSGSPVFNQDTKKVVGLHHAGWGANYYGRGVINLAVPMKKIVSHMDRFFSSVEVGGEASALEPNNSPELAVKLEIGQEISHQKIATRGDIDFYKLKILFEGSVTIQLDLNHRDGDLDLFLLDSSKKVIFHSQGTEDIELINEVLKAGEFFVAVVGHKGAMGDYKLNTL